MSELFAPRYHDEAAAYRFVEAWVWPNGPVCPHCGGFERIYELKGTATRMGVRKCGHCRKQFTVKVGTIFESSHVPLHKWLQAFFLLCSSKKGISANQLHRTLGVALRTAWFMGHRIREAMRTGALAPMGGDGGIVEADETFIGNRADKPVRRGYAHKHAVLSLVERGGSVRSFHVDGTSGKEVMPILRANIARETRVMTDEAGQYVRINKDFAGHDVVRHAAGEYGRGLIHTNTIEGYFSIFKRGMKGIYQHCAEKHLHRYLAEFDFRYNHRTALGCDDAGRTLAALKGVVGKRLTYRQSSRWQIG